jgi:FMNH2-dependent dimethyl sulfone monooxygenase
MGVRATRSDKFPSRSLKLGLFSSICSGIAVTKVPERRELSWENNLRLAQMADRCGLECSVPVGR